MSRAIFRPAIRAANWVLARKPRFVVIGTPRSGTTYFSKLCRANGVICSHEDYFTEHGPMLRNPARRFDVQGDVSWLAPPFLPDKDIVAVHQVRHPLPVIRSIVEIGLFDPRREHTRKPFVDMVRRYFDFSDDPLRSALRFYIEWNLRCEKVTDKRYRIEDIDNIHDKLSEWLGIRLVNTASTSRTTNRRPAEIDDTWDLGKLMSLPEYPMLQVLANRYGYNLQAVADVEKEAVSAAGKEAASGTDRLLKRKSAV